MRVDLMGVPIDALTMEQTLDRVEELIESGGPHQHMAINANKVVAMSEDPELARIVRSCSLISADGAAVVRAGQLLGVPIPERVTGVDLMHRILERAPARGWRVYFLGARPEVVERVVAVARERYPGLAVAGWRDGYFDPEEEPGVAAAIREARPHVLFVGISTPKKEKFLGRWTAEMGVPFTMGVGGSFDIMAGVTRRAPRFFQEHDLEWAWRLAQEPRRMWRRNARGSTLFVLRALQARLAGWRIP